MKPTAPFFTEAHQRWPLLLLTGCTFFLLLGSRALNEPDEGRYSEIAREMIETGDWLVPHFWYLPHLDKPPMTYWLVAASMKFFGQNEWAVRLPVALAGISGVWATFLIGCSIGGRRVGFWSALILQSSLFYFVMARMLTTDIFLTQFTAWAIYFFWRSWLCLTNQTIASQPGKFWSWHLAGWVAIAFGFLTKGPIALAIPLVALASLLIFHWRTFSGKKILLGGLAGGLILFLILALPWFLAVARRVPQTLDYMLFHQAVGHVLGTTIKNRRGSPFYFFAILAIGLLPWTWFLGWLWRRAHWRGLAELQKDGWLLLNVWVVFTFTLFSLTHSKLPAYILPLFPAFAALLSFRFFSENPPGEFASAPDRIWRLCAASPMFLLIAVSLVLPLVFHVTLPSWMKWQAPVAACAVAGIFWLAEKWKASTRAAVATTLGIFSLLAVTAEAPLFETNFKANQTLQPLGLALRENYRAGDAVVCWGRLPEGLPFYSGDVISAANRPFFGGMDLTQVPFEFPGNRGRLGQLFLSNEKVAVQMLTGEQRVLVVVPQNAFEHLQKLTPTVPLRLIARVGQWELFSNR
ncbi:MAG TPA: glycosyltransferase family 39 protein [Candidatus Dormibacteraeota bacterium]|nr:glycosyltransferase family 39 protein [Candidatus Dormibacteraeota bacterium]